MAYSLDPPSRNHVRDLRSLPPPSPRLAIVNGLEAPLLLLHICHAWRQVAVSTPMLWATLEIDAESVGGTLWTYSNHGSPAPASVRFQSRSPVLSAILPAFWRHSPSIREECDLWNLIALSWTSREWIHTLWPSHCSRISPFVSGGMTLPTQLASTYSTMSRCSMNCSWNSPRPL
ncbi:hypothetical protein B0H17DRAFT_1058505 [Mycena rosella]|uniref:F-box domain-containing protein n=1 Tax=Mycena rosella TaxID=1033263 RepID=A0AAD7DL55_MYCRO|nr:hypothetical protein B0H17DRAFT_1058505 [Mycena rosella]